MTVSPWLIRKRGPGSIDAPPPPPEFFLTDAVDLIGPQPPLPDWSPQPRAHLYQALS